MAGSSLLIITKHHANIQRLFMGTRKAGSCGAQMSAIAIMGAGAWGTALSIVRGTQGAHRVRLWAHEKEVRDSINARHVNELFLPDN